MPVFIAKSTAKPYWRALTPWQEWLHWCGFLLAVAVVVWAWTWLNRETLWVFLWDSPKQAIDLIDRLWPPRWAYFETLWSPLLETLHIATLGTLLGIAMAAPLAILAARNTTPHKWLLRPIALFLIVFSRSVNAIIWALLLVILLGPGPLAGILAIAFRSVGFIGKLLYEALEELDPLPATALASTGASPAQRFIYAWWPQLFPAFIAISAFRWDINVRESAVLGLVGAGGIGLYLKAALDNVLWAEVGLIILLILCTVLLSELLSSLLRHRLRHA